MILFFIFSEEIIQAAIQAERTSKLNTPVKPKNSSDKSSLTVRVTPRLSSTKMGQSKTSDNSLAYFDSVNKVNKSMDNQTKSGNSSAETQPQQQKSPMVPISQEYLQKMLRSAVGEIRSECKYIYKLLSILFTFYQIILPFFKLFFTFLRQGLYQI